MQIITNTGFKCKIDKSIINSYAFLKLIAKLEEKPTLMVDIVSLLLGDQEEKLMKHLGGTPSIEEVSNEISNIIEKLKEDNETKNS